MKKSLLLLTAICIDASSSNAYLAAAQESNNYKIWKESLENSWQAQNKIALTDKVSSLLTSIALNLYLLDQNPNQHLKEETLYAYNLLRELSSLPLARTIEKIDHQWFAEEDYKRWKSETKIQWQSALITPFARQVLTLINNIEHYTKLIMQEKNKFTQSLYQKNALYAYNFLRELLDQAPARPVTEIDRQWLDQVREEAASYQLIEQEKYQQPTTIQSYLLKQAQELLKIQDDIIPLSYADMGTTTVLGPGRYGMVLCNVLSIEQLMAIIYHELGHIVNRDIETHTALSLDEKTYREVIQEPSFKSDINRIDHYREIGKKAFDRSTPIGKHITDILSDYPTLHFYPSLDNEQKLQQVLYFLGREKRADLFELGSLFKNKLVDIILSHIALYAFGWSEVPLVPQPPFTHPSDMERALYMAGFLVDKGLDINKLFQEWYAKGTCKAIPKDITDFILTIPPKTKGSSDFIRGYKARMQRDLKYIEWKKNRQKAFKRQGKDKPDKKISSLLKNLDFWLSAVKNLPHETGAQDEVLYSYNFLRELKQLPLIDSIEEIDYQWLNELKNYNVSIS